MGRRLPLGDVPATRFLHHFVYVARQKKGVEPTREIAIGMAQRHGVGEWRMEMCGLL